MTEIKVKPTKVLFMNEESFFAIYSFDVNPDDRSKVKTNSYGNISIKGVMPKLNMGQEYKVVVKEDTSNKYKGSYELISIKSDRPTTVKEQKAYLETILTPTQVGNIYKVYKETDDVIGMIENNEFDYKKVNGLGDKTFEKLKTKVLDNIDMSEVLSFCGKFGIKYNTIAKLVKEYKHPSILIEKLKENPYILTELKGIGFRKADEIAKAMGYSMTSSQRIASCIRYTIGEENQSGHSWIESRTLLNRAIDLLNIDKSYIINTLADGIKNVKKVDDRYTMEWVFDAEQFVAMNMTQYKTGSQKVFETEELDEFLDSYCDEHDVELEENQRKFFHDWNENAIMLLIGGGGMGKSWLQRILLELIEKKSWRTALLAPTGKASKVMSNYTGKEASTIHRKAGVFEEDGEGSKEITDDVIIIDESSMCDVFILSKFFKALTNPNARILFVGDDFQLPSVGVGNFLYDTINSLKIKVSKLKKVFRQAEGGILNVATDIREGNHFLNDTDDGRVVFGKDCVFWLVDSDYIKDGVIANFKKVSKRFSLEDIAVLTPTNKGKLGTIELNKELQKIANPAEAGKKEKVYGKDQFQTIFRVGDYVMNTVNTYDIETVEGGKADIFNGDTGFIIDIKEEEKEFIVEFDGVKAKMKFGTILTNLVHGYCTTIHKSQGSQYKVVIMIADKSMTYQLNANLLYTGASRAKEFELILTQANTINRAMKKYANMERRSFLQEMLTELNDVSGEKTVGGYEEQEYTHSEVI